MSQPNESRSSEGDKANQYKRLCVRGYKVFAARTFTERSAGDDEKLLMQLSFVYRMMDSEGAHYLLLELYREDPSHLYAQFQRVRTLQSDCCSSKPPVWPQGFWEEDGRYEKIQKLSKDRDPNSTLCIALKQPQFCLFLMCILPVEEDAPIKKDNEARLQLLATEMAALAVERSCESKNDADAISFREYMSLDWSLEKSLRLAGGETPFLVGLCSCGTRIVQRWRQKLVSHIKGDKWRDQAEPEPELEPVSSRGSPRDSKEQREESPFNKRPVQFAFSPSGSGKTTSIFDQLKCHYGFYMVSCSLPVAPKNDSSARGSRRNLLDPKINDGVSKDTRHIFAMLQQMMSFVNKSNPSLDDINDWSFACISWWGLILAVRSIIFQLFLAELGTGSTPELWLSFQLNCAQFDPFLELFRKCCLFSLEVGAMIARVACPRYNKFKEVSLICLDESQEDLQITYPPDDTRLHFNLLGAAMTSIRALNNTSLQVIFAGTSLNAQKAIEVRETESEPLRDAGMKYYNEDYNVAAGFLSAMSDKAVTKVLESHGIDSPIAVRHGRALWGRVKWTAMYAEGILEEAEKKANTKFGHMPNAERQKKVKEPLAGMEEKDFYTIANAVYNTIIEDLCTRLGDLQKRQGGEEVLDKLLDAAISTDILDREHIFYEQSDMRLVQEGFARVESRIDRLKAELEQTFSVRQSEQELMEKNFFELVSFSTTSLEAKLPDNIPKGCDFENHLMDDLKKMLDKYKRYPLNTNFDAPASSQRTVNSSSGRSVTIHYQPSKATGKSLIHQLYYRLPGWGFTEPTMTRPLVCVESVVSTSGLKELTEFLEVTDLIIVNQTKDKLEELVKKGLVVADKKGTSLIAKLSERVVIDAVIRFSMGQKFDKKFMG